MKKIKKIVLLVLLLLPVILLASCKSNKNDKHVHDYIEVEIISPTCTEEGYTILKCECGDEKHDNHTEALGHDYGAWNVTKEPTTTLVGEKQKHCSRCGSILKEEIPVVIEGHVHSYGVWEIAINPTLTSTGLLVRNCSSLDSSETKELPMLDEQNYTISANSIEPTCTKVGIKEYIYSIDNPNSQSEKQSFSFRVDLPMSEHDLIHTSEGATCIKAGYEKDKCKNCDYEVSTIIQPLGHNWTRDGHECEAEKVCSRCNVVGEEALPHKLTETVTAATCSAEGKKTYTCEYCNDVIKEVAIPKVAHDLSDYVACGEPVVDGCETHQHYKATCIECNTEFTKEVVTYEHLYVANVTKLATCISVGEITYTCSSCGVVEVEKLDVNESAHSYNTGEENNGTIVYTCNDCHSTKIAINLKNTTEAEVSKDDLSQTNTVELKGKASITLDEELLNNIPDNVKISANVADKKSLGLSDNQLAQIGENEVFNFEMKNASDDSIDFNGGKVKVRIPYELGENEVPNDIAIWYIDDSGNRQAIHANYVNGYAEFETEHFSFYAVVRLSASEKCEVYGHKYVKFSYIPATCTEAGHIQYICKVCGFKNEKEHLNALGHDYEVKDTVDATCTTAGHTTYECNHCHGEKEVYIPVLGHEYVLDDTTYVESTCKAPGHEEYDCSRCNKHYAIDTIQLNHQYIDEIINSTCTEKGYTIHRCITCLETTKDSYTEPLGHNYVPHVVEPTCTEKGYTSNKCSRCDSEYQSNEVAACHKWNVSEPTCGVAQKCLICGADGLPATKDHVLSESGACINCGYGCTHAYVESTVEPTCTENGYTLKKCSTCGHEEKTNLVNKLAHNGNIICDRCGNLNVHEDFIKNLLFSPSSYKSYTITANNFVVKVDDGETTVETEVSKGTFTLKLDDNNELYGYGILIFKSIVNGEEGNAKCYAFIKNGYVYSIAEESYIADLKTADTRYGDHTTTYDPKTHYYRISFDEMLEEMDLPSSDDLVSMIDNENISKVLDAFVTVLSDNDYLANKVLTALVDKLYILDKTTSEYKLSFNINYFIDLYEFAKEHTVSEIVDYVIKDKTYENLCQFVEDLDELTIKELLDCTKELGLSLQDLVNLLNYVIPTEDEDTSIEDMINQFLENTDMSLVEYLTSSAVSSQKLFDFIKSISNEEIDLTEYQGNILDLLKQYEDINLFDELFGEDKTEIISMIDEYVEKYKNIYSHNIYVNSFGEVQKINYLIKGLIDEYGETEIDIDLDIAFGNDVTIPESLLNKIDSLYSINIKEAVIKSGYEQLKNDNNEAIGFIYKEQYTYDYINQMGEGLYRKVIVTTTHYYEIMFEDLMIITIDSDCNNWYLYHMSVDYDDHEKSIRYKTEEVSKELYYRNEELVNTSVETNTSYHNTSYEDLYMLYNSSTNVFSNKFGNSDMSNHNFKLVKYVEPEGCDKYGFEKYVCTECGYTKTDYTVNGHEHHTVRYELVENATSCKDGVKTIVKCHDCDKEYVEYISYYHRELTDDYVYAEGSTCCKDGIIRKTTCEICGHEEYGDKVYYEHRYHYIRIDLSEYGLDGRIEYEECYACGKRTENFYYDINDDYEYTSSGYKYNDNFILQITNNSTTNGCIATRTEKYTFKYKNTIIFEGVRKYIHDEHRTNVLQVETTEDNYTIKTEKETCTKCGLILREYIRTVFNERTIKSEHIRRYNDGSYDKQINEYTYDDNGEVIENIETYEYYNLDGQLTEYHVYKYKTIFYKDFITYEKHVKISANITNESEIIYDYDYDNCKKYIKEYRNGELLSEREEDCHIYYKNKTEATCSQPGTIECSCGNIKYNDPHGHYYQYNYELNMYVCEYCGLENASSNNGIVFEELQNDYESIIIGTYHYYEYYYHNFSSVQASLIIDENSYDLDDEIIEMLNMYDSNYYLSCKYSISKESIESKLAELAINDITQLDLEVYLIDGNTNSKYSMYISLDDLIA